MAADKVLTDLAKRYIEALPPVKISHLYFSPELLSFHLKRVQRNCPKIMFAHH